VSTTSGRQSEIAVVIIDGQDVVHAGLAAWLTGSVPPIKIVGNYTDPAHFISEYPAATQLVDVVLFALQYDEQRPKFEALRELCRGGHRVIVYSFLVADEIILTSLDAGAVSYVAKFESGTHVRDAIYAAATDTPYVAPRMAKALLNDRRVGRPRLSLRERDVLVEWFKTESKERVAERLFIEPSTVRTHLQRARAKYAAVGRPAPTKSALLARAIEDGILTVKDV
jgi:DNA-binding NarL/FixJ family response regulator